MSSWFARQSHMRRTVSFLLSTAALAVLAMAAARSLQVKDLPPAVRETVQGQTRNAEIKNISTETEKGVG